MSLKITRAIIDAIHDGAIDSVEWEKFPHFNFEIPKSIPGIPSDILNPRNTWADKAGYDKMLTKLASSFAKNFLKYSKGAS